MRFRAAFCISLALLVALAPGASARSPLKRADMKNIRRDANDKAAALKGAYGARAVHVTCRELTPYVARCRIRLLQAAKEHGGGRHDCTVKVVYVVTRDEKIAIEVASDGCR